MATGEHDYVSTACHHEIHDRCRLVCKFCETDCHCTCHRRATDADLPTLASLAGSMPWLADQRTWAWVRFDADGDFDAVLDVGAREDMERQRRELEPGSHTTEVVLVVSPGPSS